MFKKLLVANRGEIAIRIMRSAEELGIKTVAVYEETDKTSMHIMRADEAICIGTGPRRDYLNVETHYTGGTEQQGRSNTPWLRFSCLKSCFFETVHGGRSRFRRTSSPGHNRYGQQGNSTPNHGAGRNSSDPRNAGASSGR